MNGYISQNVTNIMPIACVVFIASVVFMHFGNTVEAYREARRAAELEKELGDMNMTLMLSQIQPHFMYNALNTIKYLTKKDPKAAESAIVKFSSYLRANMDSLTQKEPIPFKKEMVHVDNYISIERLRFGDRLNVEYDINYDDFTIPPLTIQPIAENAIKHGINQKVDGGTLRISSYEENDYVIVSIEDNGVGFDVNQVKNDDRSHIGMSNIKTRLKEMLNAEVIVESALNEGTKVIIKIPKEDVSQ
jgi:LytS/YehU family sensor histidine kinase